MIEWEPITYLITSMKGGQLNSLEELVNGVTSLCALPGSIFEDALNLPDIYHLAEAAESVVSEQVFKGTDLEKKRNCSNGGSDRSDYFNIKWEWF